MSNAATAPATALTFEEKLDRLAEVAVRVGLGLQEGQQMVLTSTVDALPLVRRVTAQAYKAGANLVTTLLTDEPSSLLRYQHARSESFDIAADWLYEGMAQAYRNGAARQAIYCSNPALLANEDPEKVSRANRSQSKAYRPAMEQITKFNINWNILAAATPDWAKLVFPGIPENEAVAKLWDAIFIACRIDQPDPVSAWKAHDANLHKRADYMNRKRFHSLQYSGPGTSLRVGLADDHKWLGGGSFAHNGAYCIPNMPTEEIFTTPHKDRAEGTVRSTKPLSHQGTLIKDIEVRFENGRIVEAHASAGESVLHKMLDTDEGARRLGEVALVPHSSPISASGVLFYNTLFDENAASHIALGQAYSSCFENAESLKTEDIAARGANESLIHVDWMIGSGEIDIDGVHADGKTEPLMRKGEWVTE